MGKYGKIGPIKKTAPKEVEVVEGASNDGPEAESSLTEQNAIELCLSPYYEISRLSNP